MSNFLELYTFKPILLIFRLLFLNTTISTINLKYSKFQRWQFLFLKIFLFSIKNAIVIYSLSMFLIFHLQVSDMFEFGLQQLQKATWTVLVVLAYTTSEHTFSAVLKIFNLIRNNSIILSKSISSPFLLIFLVYSIVYTILSVYTIVNYIDQSCAYFSMIEYLVFELGYILNGFYIAVLCTCESLIYQQYRAYNQWLWIAKRKNVYQNCVSLKLSVNVSLCKQCRLLNRTFRGYALWKFCFTYVSVITAVYYAVFKPGTLFMRLVWFGSTLGELVLLVYYHDLRLNEVYYSLI